MKSSIFNILLCALIFLLFSCIASNGKSWASIKSLKTVIHFSDNKAKEAKIVINSSNDKPLYLLECYLGPHEDRNFDYSGDFECRLTSLYSQETYSTLLTDNPKQSRDWESRGRFLKEQLIGKCADYPEYGKIRVFRLRKMKIQMILDNINFVKDTVRGELKIEGLDFNLTIDNDPTALSRIAEPVIYKEPALTDCKNGEKICFKCDSIVLNK